MFDCFPQLLIILYIIYFNCQVFYKIFFKKLKKLDHKYNRKKHILVFIPFYSFNFLQYIEENCNFLEKVKKRVYKKIYCIFLIFSKSPKNAPIKLYSIFASRIYSIFACKMYRILRDGSLIFNFKFLILI